MNWAVVYSENARKDLRNTYQYIAQELLAPETAAKQVQRIMRTIRSLEEFPMRHKLYEEEPWYSQGIRFVPVDNYLVFYLPKETENTVNIVRIMYKGRDVRKQLSETKVL